VPQALAELDLAVTEYGAGGSGGAAQAFVEMAETERARGAKPAVVLDLFVKALGKDPASCEALWGAGKLGADLTRPLDDEARGRLAAYVKSCPRAPRVADATKLLEAK
jgi:hypothetical protein